MNYNDKIKCLIDDIISDMAANREQYVKNPGVDFTRDRKLPFEMVIKLVLSMKGNTLNKELYDFFGRKPEEIASSSAFIQQRDKLTEDVFIDLFHLFNQSMTDMKTFCGYKLYAVDGSDINIAFDKDADTYMPPSGPKTENMSRGYNQYHLNAVYDLLNKVYIDATLTPRPAADERKAFIDILEEMKLNGRTIFIADRGYPSWNVFTHFKYKNNADYLICVKDSENTLVKSLPLTEPDITRKIIITTKHCNKNKDGYVFLQAKKNKMKNREYVDGSYFKP